MSNLRRQKRATTKPVSRHIPMLNKLPPELCFLILDNLPDEGIRRLLYSCRAYLSAFIEYFAARKTVKGPIYAIRYKQKFLLHNMALNQNIDVNIKDEHGTNALMIAVTESQETMVEELLSTTNIDVNVKNFNCQTPIWFAIHNKHIGITTALLETGKVDLKSTFGQGETLLHEAVRYGGVDIAKLVSLVSEPPDFHEYDASRWSPFKLIMANGYEEVFNIYTHVRSEPSVLHVAENGALFYAIENHLESFALKILHLEGFRIRHHGNGYTALMQASRRGLGLVVEELLFRPEVDQHAVDISNNNAIQYASETRHLAIVCCLFNHGISPRGNKSILWLAAEEGNYEAFQLLRSHNTYERKSNNDKCLCFTISGQDEKIITKALEMSTNINYDRALTTAVGAGVLDSMSQAIQHVFGPDEQTLFGNLLIEATKNQNTYFVKTLLVEYKVEAQLH